MQTTLIAAAFNGHTETVDKLIELQANLEAKDIDDNVRYAEIDCNSMKTDIDIAYADCSPIGCLSLIHI